MNAIDNETRLTTLDNRVQEIAAILPGGNTYVSSERYDELMDELKVIQAKLEDMEIELQVEDFLANGAGRSRDVEY